MARQNENWLILLQTDFMYIAKKRIQITFWGCHDFHSVTFRILAPAILGEVRNVEISRATQQLLWSKSHDFLTIFALARSKINQIA